MVTIKQISENSGYSPATISRLLKGDETLSITDQAKQRIIKTALSLGYDRSKIKTTIEKIAVVFWLTEQEELQDIYFRQLRLSLEKYAKINNMEIQLLTHTDNVAEVLKTVSGFIGIGSFSSQELHSFKQICPYGVLLEMNPEPDLFDTVKPDTDQMTRIAIASFLKKDYKKIGFIGGTFQNPSTQLEEKDSREITFRNYLTTKQLLKEKYIFSEGPFSVDQGYRLGKKIVQTMKNDLPEAFFIASDTIAVGVLQAFNEAQLTIPDTLEIISINDNEVAKLVSPPLTTFRIEVEELAKTAIDMLVDQIVYPRVITKTVSIGAKLVIRKSFTPKDNHSKEI